MTLQIDLTPYQEIILQRDAAAHGMDPSEYGRTVLVEKLEQGPKINFYNPNATEEELARNRAAAIALLRQWREEGDEEEMKETGEYLLRALDEDRLSDRKLFPNLEEYLT